MPIELPEIHECIANPAKLRILMLLKRHGPLTAKQMMAEGMDVSQTTLYRTLRDMEESGVLQVVSENRVRAMVEKTYDASEDLKRLESRVIRDNDVEEYSRLFSGFAFNLMREFEEYSRREGADIERDGSDFAAVTLFATAEELRDISAGIYRVIEPYLRRRSPEQSLHTFAVVMTPPFETPDDEPPGPLMGRLLEAGE